MPTWGAILQEIEALQQQGRRDAFDAVRRKYLVQLHAHTGRNVILYATKWTIPSDPPTPPEFLSITDADVHGMMEVVHGLTGTSVDIILHSPGGSPNAADAIVSYLRSKFTDIRVIVPQAAMSAATMLSCAANRVLMGKHSSLGPVDPQMILNTPLGARAVPAAAILQQFQKAQQECGNPALLASWLPMLNQYGPALLVECENASKLSKELVKTWLKDYMFQGRPTAAADAAAVAAALADHNYFMSHGRHINRAQARSLGGTGLVIDDLEADQRLQDLALSVFHAASHTMAATPTVKVIENQLGRAYLSQHGRVVVLPGGAPSPGNPAVPAQPQRAPSAPPTPSP